MFYTVISSSAPWDESITKINRYFYDKMKTIDIKSELKDLIDQETNLSLLETIKALFAQKDFDLSLEKEMISRVLESERDIKEGRVCTVDEADAKLSKRLGL